MPPPQKGARSFFSGRPSPELSADPEKKVPGLFHIENEFTLTAVLQRQDSFYIQRVDRRYHAIGDSVAVRDVAD